MLYKYYRRFVRRMYNVINDRSFSISTANMTIIYECITHSRNAYLIENSQKTRDKYDHVTLEELI